MMNFDHLVSNLDLAGDERALTLAEAVAKAEELREQHG